MAIMSGMCVDEEMACLIYSILLHSPPMFRCHMIVPGLVALSVFSRACSSLFPILSVSEVSFGLLRLRGLFVCVLMGVCSVLRM